MHSSKRNNDTRNIKKKKENASSMDRCFYRIAPHLTPLPRLPADEAPTLWHLQSKATPATAESLARLQMSHAS